MKSLSDEKEAAGRCGHCDEVVGKDWFTISSRSSGEPVGVYCSEKCRDKMSDALENDEKEWTDRDQEEES